MGRNCYEIIADIGTLRNYFLNQTITERAAVGESRKTHVDEIMNSSWTAVKPNTQAAHDFVERIGNANGYNGNSDSGSFYANGRVYKNKMEYLEERRRELIRRMKEDIEEDDEDDEDDDDDTAEDWNFEFDDDDGNEDLYRRALKYCIEHGTASVRLLQNNFPIGYIRACKIIDWMEDNDFISHRSGSKPREVLIDRKDFENIFGVPFDDTATADKAENRSVSDNSFIKRSNAAEKKTAAQNLANALSRVAQKKSEIITCSGVPDWSLWNYKDFEDAVTERLERIIKSDRRMGRKGAIKKSETYLEAVRDTHDRKMVQVYERIVYEFKTASDYIYRQLKKQIFE